MLLIIVFFLVTLPLSAAELSPLYMAAVDDEVRQARNKVLQAEYILLQAQLDKRSEEKVKKCEEAVQQKAQEMLFMLADLSEAELRVDDVDFCLVHNAGVNAVDVNGYPPLLDAVASKHITLVRMLIAARADAHHRADCSFWGKDTTLVHVADEFDNKPAMAILLEAGAPIPDEDGRPITWFWNDSMIAHRQHLINTINETRLIVPNDVTPIIANYAFGQLPHPTAIDPETELPIYPDEIVVNEVDSNDEGDE